MTDFTASSLGFAFINIAWRGTAMLALAYAATRVLPSLSASRRREINLLSLVAVVCVTIATLISTAIEIQNPPERSLLTRLVSVNSAIEIFTPAKPATATPWLQAAVAIWIAGTLFALTRTAARLYQSVHAVRNAKSINDEMLGSTVAQLAARTGLPRTPELRQSALIKTAAVCGGRNKVILLSECWPTWSMERREQILTHELCHIRNHDIPATVFAQVARALLWWNPAVHFTVRGMTLQQEYVCDEQVVRAGASPESYAETLLDLAKVSSSRALGALPAVAASAIPERVEHLLRTTQSPSPEWHRWYSRMVLAAALIGIALLPRFQGDSEPITEQVIDLREAHNTSPATVRIDRDATGNIRVQPANTSAIR